MDRWIRHWPGAGYRPGRRIWTVTWTSMGRSMPQAENVYRQILSHDPADGEARKGLSTVHQQMAVALAIQGRSEEALARAQAAVELDGQSAEGHHVLGVMLQGQGRIESAIEAF